MMMNIISKILRALIAIVLFIGGIYLLMFMITHLFSVIVAVLVAVAVLVTGG